MLDEAVDLAQGHQTRIGIVEQLHGLRVAKRFERGPIERDDAFLLNGHERLAFVASLARKRLEWHAGILIESATATSVSVNAVVDSEGVHQPQAISLSTRHLSSAIAVAALGLGALSGCGQSLSAGSAAASGTARRGPHAAVTHTPQPPRRPQAVPISNASPGSVQPQPAPGSCRARSSGLYSEPDPGCTPGALNPAVTQATIDRTICVSGYTEAIRPSESITEAEKVASMAAYGDGGSPGGYEYDHLVSLELGGATNDPRNLWPEPGDSPNPKDSVENALHRMVCDREMPLSDAQLIIARSWVAWAKSHG
jgi:hypothetical protein